MENLLSKGLASDKILWFSARQTIKLVGQLKNRSVNVGVNSYEKDFQKYELLKYKI